LLKPAVALIHQSPIDNQDLVAGKWLSELIARTWPTIRAAIEPLILAAVPAAVEASKPIWMDGVQVCCLLPRHARTEKCCFETQDVAIASQALYVC
jgi:hypothetical protein